MTQLIDPMNFTRAVTALRSFFLAKGFIEVHTQNRLSILAACEDPTTVATYNYAGEVWPLPQTGQMWLEYELLKNPSKDGFFCVSTSYRQEPNIIEGRHDLIFPMFEFEFPGTIDDLESMIVDTIENTSEVFKQDFAMLKDTKVSKTHVKKLVEMVPTNVMDGFVQYLCAHKPYNYWDLFNAATYVNTHHMNRNNTTTHKFEQKIYPTISKWAKSVAEA